MCTIDMACETGFWLLKLLFGQCIILLLWPPIKKNLAQWYLAQMEQAIKEICVKKYHQETDKKLSKHGRGNLTQICVCFRQN